MKSGERVQVPRAQRFPLGIPLYYRKGDMPDWHVCKTTNMSRTGILFQTDETIPINSILDIRVQFPKMATLFCKGSVVRSQESEYAVSIYHCNLRK
jgi:hypothetical protein